LFPQNLGREAARPGGPGGCSSRLWGAERPAEPQSEAFSLAACFCPQAKQAHGPVQGQASVQDAHKGRRAAFSGLETKRGGLRGEPGQGRLRRKHQATRGSHRKPSTRGRAGQIPRSGISLPEGGGLGGESPKGESPGEFPAELGGREGISRSTGMTERPTQKTRLPRRGKRFQTAASEACGAGVLGGGCGGLWRRGKGGPSGNLPDDKSGNSCAGSLIALPGRRPVLVGGGKRDVLRAQALGNHERGIS